MDERTPEEHALETSAPRPPLRNPGPRWFQRRLLRLIALVTLLTCLWLAATVMGSLATATLDVAAEYLRFTLRVTAERLAGTTPDADNIESALDELWSLPGAHRWILTRDGVEFLALGESETPAPQLHTDARRLLAEAPHGSATGQSAAAVLGGPGKRRVVGAVPLDSGLLLVVEYEGREFWRHRGDVFVSILFAVFLATCTAAFLLSHRLARPILKRLGQLQRVLERYGAGDTEARLSAERTPHEFTPVFSAFNQMADHIDQLEWERTARAEETRALLASLAHDINTPMTVIRGYAEMLHERGAALGEEARGRIASEFLGQSLYVQSMLEDLLAITRAEHRRLPLNREAVDLDTLFDSLIDTFQPVASRQGTVLLAEGHGLAVEADPLRLRQILTNLLRNAIVHGGGDTVVELQAQRRDHAMVLTVEDDGVGVPESLVPHLFERGRRSPEGDAGGWGLGLATVRMLTTLHGGTCRHLPRERGAAFEVELPIDPPHHENPFGRS